MAKKRTIRRKRASGYTVGPSRIRRRKLNGTRKTASRRRRMNGTTGSELTKVVKIAVGAVAGGIVIGMTEGLVKNYYVRAGGTAALGLLLGKVMPAAKDIGTGMAVAGVAGAGMKAMQGAGIMPGTLNGRKRLSPEQLRQLTAKLKEAGALNGEMRTLNEGMRTLNASESMYC